MHDPFSESLRLFMSWTIEKMNNAVAKSVGSEYNHAVFEKVCEITYSLTGRAKSDQSY